MAPKKKPTPATSKLKLVALKPSSKASETLPSPSPPESVEPVVPVEVPTPVEAPPPVQEPARTILKPIKRSSAPTPSLEVDSSLPENSNAIFQAVGIIVGDVIFSDKKAHITISDKEYPLFYASSHKKAFEALKIHLKNTGQSQQRLIVYPKIMHFPKREQPYLIGFQVVGFHSSPEKPEPENNSSLTIDQELQDFEFKLSGLWQFIPVCQTP